MEFTETAACGTSNSSLTCEYLVSISKETELFDASLTPFLQFVHC